MKIAIFGDIHGNSVGLRAVLSHIEHHGGVDAYWLLGDYCLGGGDPIGVLEQLVDLPNTTFIRGNTDHYLFNPSLPSPSEIPADSLNWLMKAIQTQYWTIGALSQTQWLKWLTALPIEQRIQLSDDVSVLLVHSSPGTDEGAGLTPEQSDEDIHQLFNMAKENLIVVGHTHIVQQRQIGDQLIINPGSIGKPVNGTLHSTYALLNVQTTSYDVAFYDVEYDITGMIQQMVDVGYPDAEAVKHYYYGDNNLK